MITTLFAILKQKKSLFSTFKNVLAVLLLASPSTHAKEVRLHYTCFVQLQDQSQVVQQFVTSEETKHNFLAQLVGKKVFFSDGISASKVETVKECVTKNGLFQNKKARIMAEKALW